MKLNTTKKKVLLSNPVTAHKTNTPEPTEAYFMANRKNPFSLSNQKLKKNNETVEILTFTTSTL